MTFDKEKGKILMRILFSACISIIEKLKLCPLAASDGWSNYLNYLNIVVFK